MLRRNNNRGGSALTRGIASGAGFAIGNKVAGAVINSVTGRNSQQQRTNRMTQNVVNCFSCKGRNQANVRFCGHCGTDMFAPSANGAECQQCGFVCENGYVHCGNCGAKFQ